MAQKIKKYPKVKTTKTVSMKPITPTPTGKGLAADSWRPFGKAWGKFER